METRREPARVVGRIEGDPGRRELEDRLLRLFPQLAPEACLFVTYRDPEDNAGVLAQCRSGALHPSVRVTEWHQDGVPGDACRGLLLWSNREPTEVREIRSRRPLGPFAPGDVVLVDNLACEHRVPPDPSPDRAFARVFNVDPRDFP